MSQKKRMRIFPLFAAAVAAIGGLLFGYSTSVISGVLLFISHDFQLTVFEQELVVSTILIGAVAGSFGGGFAADRFGRKKTLLFSLVLFFIGTAILGAAEGFESLLWGRFVSGLSIGILSVAVPLYIAEMSPPKSRGVLVSFYQLAISIGILMAYLISYAYSEKGEWREMFLFALIPLAIQGIGLFFLEETPSWLLSRNRKEEAERVFLKIKESDSAPTEEAATQKHWKELLSPSLRKPLFVGIGVSVFQQITGINTVIYYAPKIFQSAGFQTAQTAIFATLLIGVVNVAMTAAALWLIDRLGRRPLLIGGLIGMAASLLLLGIAFIASTADSGIAAVAALMIYVSFFAVSLGPVTWLILSEIFPLGIRGRAMGIATFINWVCNYLVSLTFLSLLDWLGSSPTFWLYGAVCLGGLWFVLKQVPETKGKTFEQIQNFWKK